MERHRITHTALVTGVRKGYLTARYEPASGAAGCPGCAMAFACRPDGSGTVTIKVAVPEDVAPAGLVGRKIEIEAGRNSQRTAAMALFLLPLSAFLAIAVAGHLAGSGDGITGTAALAGAAAVYPAVNRLFRKKNPVWKMVKRID